MHATHLTKKFNVLAVVYFTIIACGQIVLFPHSQPIFLFLVTMAMAVRLFTLQPQYKNLRFLVLSIISHHLVFTILHSSNSISMLQQGKFHWVSDGLCAFAHRDGICVFQRMESAYLTSFRPLWLKEPAWIVLPTKPYRWPFLVKWQQVQVSPLRGQTVVRYRVNNEYRELTSDTH